MKLKKQEIKPFDYDEVDIHVNYRKSRVLSETTPRLWLSAISKFAAVESTELIVDLGSGTGRFLEPLRSWFDASVIGIEPSANMSSEAVKEDLIDDVQIVRGRAENIPLVENSIDLVFISMAIHHFRDRPQAYREIRRILNAGKFLAIRTPTHETLNNLEWFKCFPSGLQVDIDRMLPKDDLIKEVCNSGLEFVHHATIKQLTANTYREFFNNLSLRAVSALKQISDEEFESGLKQFQQYCEKIGWETPFYESFDLFIFGKREQ